MVASTQISTLRFAWWNVADFAHFDKNRSAHARWPSSQDEYDDKCCRVDRVLTKIQSTYGPMHLIGLTEITRQAAMELKDRLFPNWDVLSVDPGGSKSELTLAVLWNKEISLSEDPPLMPSRMPAGARPMVVMDFKYELEWIRFIFCHWVAFDGEMSDKYRRWQADYLSSHAYSYLKDTDSGFRKHLVIAGDFNTEPYGLMQTYLSAHKHRKRAMDSHYRDEDVERVNLYNCAWRFTGEKWPHGEGLAKGFVDGAGTYYYREEKSWHTFDQLIVDSTLLTDRKPYLDEKNVEIIYMDEAVDRDGLPRKFDSKTHGVSDHVPLVGCLVLR